MLSALWRFGALFCSASPSSRLVPRLWPWKSDPNVLVPAAGAVGEPPDAKDDGCTLALAAGAVREPPDAEDDGCTLALAAGAVGEPPDAGDDEGALVLAAGVITAVWGGVRISST